MKVFVTHSCLTLCKPARLLCPMEVSSKKYWSGLPFPSPGDLPNPGIEPKSPAFQAVSLPSELPGTHKSFLRLISSKMDVIKLLSYCEIILFLLNWIFKNFCLAYGAYERQFFTFINQRVAIFKACLPSAYFHLVCSGESCATVPHSVSSEVLSNFPFLLES